MLAVAAEYLGSGRSDMTPVAHWPPWRTRQEERELLPSQPPHEATTGLEPGVRKVMGRVRDLGRGGGEQPPGYSSVEERRDPLYPPVSRTWVADVEGGREPAYKGSVTET